MFWLFGRKACGILTPLLGIKPAPPALEGEVFTTGPLGKSLPAHFVSLLEFWFLSPIVSYHALK